MTWTFPLTGLYCSPLSSCQQYISPLVSIWKSGPPMVIHPGVSCPCPRARAMYAYRSGDCTFTGINNVPIISVSTPITSIYNNILRINGI